MSRCSDCNDFSTELLNRNQHTSFAFASLLYTQYSGDNQKGTQRYIKRQIFHFEDNKGAYLLPQFMFFPMCQGVHWTVMILNTSTHKLIYLDPFHPNAELPQAEKEAAWLFGSWMAADIPSIWTLGKQQFSKHISEQGCKCVYSDQSVYPCEDRETLGEELVWWMPVSYTHLTLPTNREV